MILFIFKKFENFVHFCNKDTSVKISKNTRLCANSNKVIGHWPICRGDWPAWGRAASWPRGRRSLRQRTWGRCGWPSASSCPPPPAAGERCTGARSSLSPSPGPPLTHSHPARERKKYTFKCYQGLWSCLLFFFTW